MTLKDKLVFGAVVVVVTIIAQFMLVKLVGPSVAFGAAGNLLIENYDPYVRTNGGINTNDPMTVGGAFTSTLGQVLSGNLTNTGTFTQGSTGTAFSRLNGGTCYVQPYATTIAASTTAQVDCQGTQAVGSTNTANDTALAGVTLLDSVQAIFASSTSKQSWGSIDVVGASASTTPGFITLIVSNNSGGVFTWPTTGNASGTVSYFDNH